MVPGAIGTPGSAAIANASSVPFWFRTGATLGATAPEICGVAAVSPGTVAVAVTTTCEPVVRGVHVPEYKPDAEFARFSPSGGSPFENAATTWPFPTGLPQLSFSGISSGMGHDAGAEKSFSSPVCVGTICVGVQVLVASGPNWAAV